MSARVTRVRPDESAAFYEALEGLLRIYQFRDRDRACYGDVTPNECHVLEALSRRGGLRVSELAEVIGLHKSNASRIAFGLRRRGLVARSVERGDGRAVRLLATARGRMVHAEIKARVCAAHAPLLATHQAPVRRAFVALLRQLAAEAAERIGGTCSAAPRREEE